MRLTEADAPAVRGQTVRFRFDLYLTPEAAGSTDIQTFLADDAEAFRAFNLLIDQAGNMRYYAAGAEHPVPGKVPVGAWVPVEILADYARHVYRARVGEVAFVAPFDKAVDEFTQIYFGKSGSPTYYYDNVLVELVPELAQELAGAMAAFVSAETELLRPLETRRLSLRRRHGRATVRRSAPGPRQRSGSGSRSTRAASTPTIRSSSRTSPGKAGGRRSSAT